jgi:hypothetical protein
MFDQVTQVVDSRAAHVFATYRAQHRSLRLLSDQIAARARVVVRVAVTLVRVGERARGSNTSDLDGDVRHTVVTLLRRLGSSAQT